MKKSSKKIPTWTDLKRQLADLDRPALLGLIQDLYAASKSNQDISIAKAKKAISDYKKAIGRPEGLAELMVFYRESCMNLLGYCGMDDEGYSML